MLESDGKEEIFKTGARLYASFVICDSLVKEVNCHQSLSYFSNEKRIFRIFLEAIFVDFHCFLRFKNVHVSVSQHELCSFASCPVGDLLVTSSIEPPLFSKVEIDICHHS